MQSITLLTRHQLCMEAILAFITTILSAICCGLGAIWLAVGYEQYLSPVPYIASIFAVIAGGVCFLFFFSVALIRLSQVLGKTVSDQADSRLRVLGKWVGGIAVVLFLATTIESALSAGIWECGYLQDLSCSTHISLSIFSFLSFIVVTTLVHIERSLERVKEMLHTSMQRAAAQVPVYQGSSLTQPILQATEDNAQNTPN